MAQHHLFDASPPPTSAPPADVEVKTIWEEAAEADIRIARVVFNRPMETVYSYRIPDPLRTELRIGQRVKVPFGQGNTTTIGYCVGIQRPADASEETKKYPLKDLHSILDPEPLLSEEMLTLTRWIGQRYLCSWGQVLDGVVPAGVKKKAGTRMTQFFTAAPDAKTRMAAQPVTKKQQNVMDVLLDSDRSLRLEELTRAARCTVSPINTLRKKGYIHVRKERTQTSDFADPEVLPSVDLKLNDDQQSAVNAVVRQVRSGEHRTFLLHGVTGSGKTEVYIQAIREVVAYRRQAIVLVPEISLTPQTIRRFKARFPSVAVLHSHQSDGERHHHWERIRSGQVQVIVGARSAIFAPTPHLGLVIIDEEHETSFKQETTPRYHAREVARRRCELEKIPLILGSATPTLETWMRSRDEGELFRREANEPGLQPDRVLSLPRRVASRPLPPVSIIDIRGDARIRKGEAIGRGLETAMRTALADGGQVILFLNLRGFSPTLWCRACGESVRCPDCDITLTWHRDRNVALCHFCDHEAEPPRNCPHCNAPGLMYFGTGTQKLEEEVTKKFRSAGVIRMDSDSMRRPGSHEQALERFRNGEAKILLGTQMIAKGLDFPNVTLVGVINADTILHQPDLRASERTFQLIAQVAGRTGRGDRGGRVLVQSSSPAEPAIEHAARHDFIGFARLELALRQELNSPPFTHLVRVILRGEIEERVAEIADYFALLLRSTAEQEQVRVTILGPAPAPIARLKGKYRYHFQLTAATIAEIAKLWTAIQDRLPTAKDVEHQVDVDALNMR